MLKWYRRIPELKRPKLDTRIGSRSRLVKFGRMNGMLNGGSIFTHTDQQNDMSDLERYLTQIDSILINQKWRKWLRTLSSLSKFLFQLPQAPITFSLPASSLRCTILLEEDDLGVSHQSASPVRDHPLLLGKMQLKLAGRENV